MTKSLYLLLAAVLFVGCHRDEKTDEPVTGPFVFFETRVGEAGTLPQRDGEAFGVFGYPPRRYILYAVLNGKYRRGKRAVSQSGRSFRFRAVFP